MKVTSLSEFSAEKVSFSDVEKVSFNSNDFERININVEYSDGEVGSLILETDNCFSFGLQSDKEKFENGSGYTLPIVMFRRSPSGELHPTEHQQNCGKMHISSQISRKRIYRKYFKVHVCERIFFTNAIHKIATWR